MSADRVQREISKINRTYEVLPKSEKVKPELNIRLIRYSSKAIRDLQHIQDMYRGYYGYFAK